MALTNRYTLKRRRRREQKTNYASRLELLKARQVRAVIRKSNAHTSVQFVQYTPDGDTILAQASTKELPGLGWKSSTSSLPAAYLAGMLAATRVQKKKIISAIVDLGMQRPSQGGRLFAVVQGILDAGVSVPVSEQALPSEERVLGKHIDEKIAKQVEAIKKKVQ